MLHVPLSVLHGQPVIADIPGDAPIEHFETAYSMAVCAWNTALLQAEGATVELDKLRAVLNARYPAHLLPLFDRLLTRKHRAFGGDPRHISSFEVSLTGEGPQVEAVSVCSARRLVNDPPPSRAS